MKKLKYVFLVFLSVFLSVFSFACTDNKTTKPILVNSITLNAEEVSLRPSETFELVVTVSPNNATNKDIEYVLSDDSYVSLIKNNEDKYKVTIKAKDNISGIYTTYLQVKTEDESIYSKACKITVMSEKITLPSPQNIKYDNLNQIIYWDEVATSCGYSVKVSIEGEEDDIQQTATNSLKIDAYYGKIISCEVKCLGDGEIYLDSEYSETSFKFLQLEEPLNLKNNGSTIKFDKVENANSYIVLVYENEIKQTPDFTKTILDSEYNVSDGVVIEELETSGKTYFVKVQSVAKQIEGVISYPSICENYIKISKFDNPVVSNSDFKFTYNTLTISWKSVEHATGYVITRTGNGEPKTYNFTADETTLKIDTIDDKLTSGVYSYTLKILGDNEEFLDSGESNKLQIEKLSAPTLRVENGKLAWNSIENSNGFLFKVVKGSADEINNIAFTQFNSDILSFELNSSFSEGTYYFVISSVGNGVNTISSEISSVFSANKLPSPDKAMLNDNKTLKITTNKFVNNLKVYLTHNSNQPIILERNDLILDETNNNKYIEIDMADSNYVSGDYSVYAINFKEGYFTSEASVVYKFKKLDNTLNAKIEDGKLKIQTPNDAYQVKYYLNGTSVEYRDDKFYINSSTIYSILPEIEYNLVARFYPSLNETDVVISNLSNSYKFSKLLKADKLYVEDGEIKLLTSTSGNAKFEVKIDENNIVVYSNIKDIKLVDDTIYMIRMFYDGGNSKLSSDYSNSIKVKLIKNVTDFKLNSDLFTFSKVDLAKDYNVNMIVRENNQNSIIQKQSVKQSFSLTNLVKELIPNAYNELENYLEFYITYVAGDLQNPESNDNIVVGLNREIYGQNGKNRSNSIKVRIMPAPTNFKIVKLMDALEGETLEIGKMYFTTNNSAKLFELKYNSSYKILSLTDLIKVEESGKFTTYEIDTQFLASGDYTFELKAISQTNIETIGADDVIYNVSSLDKATISESITKIKSINSLKISRSGETEKIVINDDDTEYAYILTINGETIYDDVLGEGKSLEDAFGEVSGIQDALNLIKKFKNKERTLPKSYKNTFNINCYKISVPSLLDSTGKRTLRSNLLTNPLQVTRINAPSLTVVNGYCEWLPVENASSYNLYKTKLVDGEYVNDVKITSLSGGSENRFNIYEYFAGNSGDYSIALYAIANKDNYLSSGESSKINFKILDIPNLKVESGELVWNSVESSAGYLLEVYTDGTKIDSFVVEQSVLSYDVMKTSKNKVLEGGEYTFKIQALGVLSGDSSTIMSGKISNDFTATKLNTPNKAFINKGRVNLISVNETGVDYYQLNINDDAIRVETNNLIVELNSRYASGKYKFSYLAKGKDGFITSNTSQILEAEKLNATNKVYIHNGEIYYDEVTCTNYKNNSSPMEYDIKVKREDIVKEFSQEILFYNLSKDDAVPSDLYNIEVTCLGDDYYYLNSNATVLNNVVKLGSITNFRVEDGKLKWDNPLKVNGLGANVGVIPNGMQLVLEQNSRQRKFTLSNFETEFVLNNTFEDGRYFVTMQNIGNNDNSLDGYNYVNGRIVEYTKQVGSNTIKYIYKLKAVTDLNIKDGINLTWVDPNSDSSVVDSYLLNINYINGESKTSFSGVIKSLSQSIIFENIGYYINDDNENKLVMLTDENVTYQDETPYYNGFVVNKFSGEGSFEVNVSAYGDTKYITSDASETIKITRPSAVTDLKVEHGRISWSASEDANGYILTITRTDLYNIVNSDDLEYNNTHKIIYVTDKTYYNLTTTQRIYNISVRAYSLISIDNSQTMASKSVEITSKFDSFRIGDGTDDNPYIVDNVNTLNYIRYNNFATYKLDSDITLTESIYSLFTKDYPFVGKLIGENKSINNLKIINKNDATYVGLFGYIDKQTLIDDRAIEESIEGIFVRKTVSTDYVGKVYGLNITNVDINSGLQVGAIAGYNNGIISNVYVTGNVSSQTTQSTDVGGTYYDVYSGGIVGINDGQILNSVSYAKIQPDTYAMHYSGGISARNNGTIYNCKVLGDVYGVWAGGITAENNNIIEGCEVNSNIICYNYSYKGREELGLAGGIAGKNNAVIKNCFVNNSNFGQTESGVINASNNNLTAGKVLIGGLVGDNIGKCYNNVVYTQVYNKNDKISCSKQSLIGYNRSNEPKYNYCLTINLTNADGMYDGYTLNNTNKEVSTIISEEIATILNSSEYRNEKITWSVNEKTESGQTIKYLSLNVVE